MKDIPEEAVDVVMEELFVYFAGKPASRARDRVTLALRKVDTIIREQIIEDLRYEIMEAQADGYNSGKHRGKCIDFQHRLEEAELIVKGEGRNG